MCALGYTQNINVMSLQF